jgi:hypothetical protein
MLYAPKCEQQEERERGREAQVYRSLIHFHTLMSWIVSCITGCAASLDDS